MKLRAGANDELIDNCDLPYYMAASNVIFIQRKGQLNSVNIPLAFLFHKVVIGPDSGNIGELLRNTGNPVFRSDKKQDIIRALKEARHLSARGKRGSELRVCDKKHEYKQSWETIRRTLRRIGRQASIQLIETKS